MLIYSETFFSFSIDIFALIRYNIHCCRLFLQQDIRRRIEVVITRTTRNRLIGDEPVRGFESLRLRQSLESQKLSGLFLFSVPVFRKYSIHRRSSLQNNISHASVIVRSAIPRHGFLSNCDSAVEIENTLIY